MSAELLRQITIDRINKAIDEQVDYLTETHDQPLDAIRIAQGTIRGLKLAVQLQDQIYRGMN